MTDSPECDQRDDQAPDEAVDRQCYEGVRQRRGPGGYGVKDLSAGVHKEKTSSGAASRRDGFGWFVSIP